MYPVLNENYCRSNADVFLYSTFQQRSFSTSKGFISKWSNLVLKLELTTEGKEPSHNDDCSDLWKLSHKLKICADARNIDSSFLSVRNEQNELADWTCIMATVLQWRHINENKGDSNCRH